ncbi:non-ribosomal peptide synthetase/MFS transporter [Pseudonocardia sp. TRM90224]|uniref:non-ribosomal peptide synthetase/MFS transporter n=1 Tax=Pseudonocardia sp. TRM90224 TaxID=2812678 RepID=UPI001E561AE9|nr:non-ribosomal peptide synthetase [Pseudonocardia sp. TRM90224]
MLTRRLRRRTVATTIPSLPDGEPAPLSFAQERLWFMDQYLPGSPAYTIPVARRLRGPLDPTALEAALAQVAARHEPLRSRFPAAADGTPALVVDGAVPLDTAEAPDVEGARELVTAFLAAPFDLAVGPVARALLVRIAPDDHVLALAVHHIAADGWSVGLLVGEILTALSGGMMRELPVRYRDYAGWQRAQDAERDVDFWRERLVGVAPLELPTDRPRPPEPTHEGATHRFTMPAAVVAGVERLAAEHGATPYMVLLAAFAALLGRRARQHDVTIGSPTAGRPVPELDGLVGCFTTMLTMRVDLAGDPSFTQLLHRVRDSAVDAYAHQDLPFERLVAELNVPREVSRTPLFQVVFAMQNYRSGTGAPGRLDVADFGPSVWATRFDLELYTGGDGGFQFIFNTALFTEASIVRLGEHLTALVAGAVAEPGRPVSSIEVLTPAEHADRMAWNDTALDLGPPALLHRPVEEQAVRTPDAVALRFPGGQLTYAEVDRRAEHLAAQLVASGVRHGDLVAVVMERGWEQVVAVLAIGKAGAAYLPVDADLPAQRRAELIERGGCAVAVVQPWLERPVGATSVPVYGQTGSRAPAAGSHPDDLAYVIFTSGSTGTPKGVMIEHRMALNTVRDVNSRFGVGPADRVLALSALSFDLSVWDVYGTLAAGGTLVLGAPSEGKDPAAWARTVAQERITVWNSVPALAELLVEHAEHEGTDLTSLRLVMMSGDWIPPTLPARIRALAPAAEIISMGGATEGSIWSIVHQIDQIDQIEHEMPSVPYGRPLANQTFHVLDTGMCEVPVGVPGELHIGGDGVARGYWNDPERTAASFVVHPRTGERLYRTGDLGRYHDGGLIEFLGRVDAQVKIRGYRIELGEIEAHLQRHHDVEECVVATHGSGNAATLVGYVVASGCGPDPVRLRAHLAAALPAYMVPSRFVVLERLPLTANGKVDRARLPAPEQAPASGRTTPSTATERLLVEAWEHVLERPVGVDDNFFDAGGHSLLAIKVVARLRRLLPEGAAPVAVMDLFTHPTVRELAAHVDGSERGPRGVLHRLTPARGEPELTFVCVPYGGGSAMVYQPLADALPATHALWSLAIPGHDVGIDEEQQPLEVVAARCVEEIQERIAGPVVIYGHCGVGSAMAVEIATRLEAAGRAPEAVYIGAIFPFARPGRGGVAALARLAGMDYLRNDRNYANWLTSMGLSMGDLDPAQARQIVRNTRRDTEAAEEYFTGLYENGAARLRAPVISVAGERDPSSEFYEERFREWHHLTDTTAAVVIEEAGHYFQKYRAAELAEIITSTHVALRLGATAELGGAGWRFVGSSTGSSTPAQRRADPSMRRFLAVAAGQLISMTGSALTEFAIPIWIYLTTGSLAQFALFAVIGLVPGLLVAPLVGAIVDRSDRRTVILCGDVAAGGTQLVLGVLLWTGNLQIWHIYPLLAALSVALTFQRVAYSSATAQLVPKRYLGHANGVVQLVGGTAQLIVPLVAVGLMAVIGLAGILIIDVVSYAFAIAVVAFVRFPRTMAWRRKESVLAEIAHGFRLSWGNPDFRAMLVFFAVLNIFLSPLFLMISPLVLSFGTLDDVAVVSFLSGAGFAVGGLTMTVWGGPARRRMRGVLLATLVLSAFCLVTGLRAELWVIAAGAFGMALSLSLLNGTYATIVQTKVPQRFHGRVFSLNTMIAWSTLPIGFGLVAPYGAAVAEPLLAPDGVLASSVGAVIGVGEGRGIGLLYVAFALCIAVLVVVTLRRSRLRWFDETVPDAVADDLVGLAALEGRSTPHS